MSERPRLTTEQLVAAGIQSQTWGKLEKTFVKGLPFNASIVSDPLPQKDLDNDGKMIPFDVIARDGSRNIVRLMLKKNVFPSSNTSDSWLFDGVSDKRPCFICHKPEDVVAWKIHKE
jgi:hypothetical protein